MFHRYVYYLLHYLFELLLEIPKNVHFSRDGDPYLLSEGYVGYIDNRIYEFLVGFIF